MSIEILKRPILVFALVFICACAPEPGSERHLAASVRRAVSPLLEEVPGAAIAIAQHDTIIFEAGFGLADVYPSQAVTSETRFPVFSITKTWTDLLLVQLVLSGALDPDAPIGRYLETGSPEINPITTWQLATHTSGIRHYANDDEATAPGACETIDEALALFIHDPLRFEPGSDHLYSSWGYVLLSALIESRVEIGFDQALRQNVLAQYGANAWREPTDQTTLSYVRAEGPTNWDPVEIDVSCKWGGGGYYATARDIALVQSGALLSDTLPAEMRDMIYSSRADGVIRVTGASTGGAVLVLSDEDSRLTVSIIANARPETVDMAELGRTVLDAARLYVEAQPAASANAATQP